MKHIFALIGVTISLIAYAPYLWQTITKKIKPHPFSWFVLTLTISTNGLLVLFNGGGARFVAGLRQRHDRSARRRLFASQL